MMDPLQHRVAPPRRRKRRVPLSQEIRSVYRLLLVTVVMLGVGSTIAYLVVNSDNSAKGYTLQQLQSDYERLQAEQRKLEHQVIEVQSYIHLEAEESLDDMESSTSDDITFTEEDYGVAQYEQ
jgi:cell division protein FtsB